MLVSGGYPGADKKGIPIHDMDKVNESLVFQAGTKKDGPNVLTNGGRVIALSSYGKDMQEALLKSYRSAALIDFENKYYRKDIGFDL